MGRNYLIGCLGVLLLCLSCADGNRTDSDGVQDVRAGGTNSPAADIPFAGYPASDAQLTDSPLADGESAGGFTRLDSGESGISFVSEALDNDMIVDDIGSQAGMAAADYDGDGDIDIYLCGISNDNLLFHHHCGTAGCH